MYYQNVFTIEIFLLQDIILTQEEYSNLKCDFSRYREETQCEILYLKVGIIVHGEILYLKVGIIVHGEILYLKVGIIVHGEILYLKVGIIVQCSRQPIFTGCSAYPCPSDALPFFSICSSALLFVTNVDVFFHTCCQFIIIDFSY